MKLYVPIILLLITLIQGCSAIKTGVAYYKSTDNFTLHPQNSAVLFEPDAEKLADIVVQYLPSSMKKIEERHYEQFSKPVKVYICSSYDCMEQFTTRRNARGAMIGDKLFLSPKLLERPATIQNILTHELSHLHLSQKIGKFSYFENIPGWFQEGLATYVSDGGGSENITRSEAVIAITSDPFFIPDESGSLLFIKGARAYGFKEHYQDPAIAQHMYYKQAELFVEYLHHTNEMAFKGLMQDVLNNHAFKSAFRNNYGMSINEAWQRFVSTVDF